jgi:hypothetical protein
VFSSHQARPLQHLIQRRAGAPTLRRRLNVTGACPWTSITLWLPGIGRDLPSLVDGGDGSRRPSSACRIVSVAGEGAWREDGGRHLDGI